MNGLDIKFDRIKRIYRKYLVGDAFKNELPLKKFLSDWDPGKKYRADILSKLVFQKANNASNDVISYKNNDLEYDQSKMKRALLYKFNATKVNSYNDLDLLITPDGTSSMLLLFFMLQQNNVKRIAILQPSYYLVEVYCKMFNIDYDFIWLDPFDGFHVSANELVRGKYDAVWITSPLFGTSITFQDSDIQKMQLMINKGMYCIFDESMYECRKELIQKIKLSEKTFFIYSPHKSISINNSILKFSAVISKKKQIQLLNSFQVFYPNIILDMQNHLGVKHFLFFNYDLCFNVFKAFFDKNLQRIQKLISGYNDVFIGENITHACYVSIYVLNTRNRDVYSIVDDIAKKTGYMVIPSDCHYYENKSYFSFRVNLLLDIDEIEDGLMRILEMFQKKK